MPGSTQRKSSKHRNYSETTYTPRSPGYKTETTPDKLLKALEMINKLMSQITDFDAWIEEYLGDDRDAVSELVRICATISDNLGGRAQQSRAISKDVDCSKDDEEAFHVYRDGNKAITLLRSVKRLVPAGSTILQKKVFGYICEGNGIPMKYALAGYNDILADDPDFLQSSFWTDQVYQFAQREHVALGSHGYDAKHGKPRGYAHASHVECKLALWYATMCVPGKHLSISAKRTRIWELLKDNVVRRATMYINRAPCGVCMTFVSHIEHMTGILFEIKLYPTLGRLALVKNSHNQVGYELYVNDEEADSSDSDMDSDLDDIPAVATSSKDQLVDSTLSIRQRRKETNSMVPALQPKSANGQAVLRNRMEPTLDRSPRSTTKILAPPSPPTTPPKRGPLRPTPPSIKTLALSSTLSSKSHRPHKRNHDQDSDDDLYHPSGAKRKRNRHGEVISPTPTLRSSKRGRAPKSHAKSSLPKPSPLWTPPNVVYVISDSEESPTTIVVSHRRLISPDLSGTES